MLNNHEVNLTDEEAAAEVARVAKTYPRGAFAVGRSD